MAENLIGSIINNQFRVDALMNSQGSSFVYKVWNLKDETPLLMKTIADLDDNDAWAYSQVVREANRHRRLIQPNIIPFYGLFKAKEFFFTLEKYIDGSTLDQLMGKQEGGHLPMQDALIIIKGISDALAYAHSSGVVHGDIKPENVTVSKEGNIFLTGFKINPPIVNTTKPLNPDTPANPAPGTSGDESPAPTIDIQAEGILFFEMLTGERLVSKSGNENEFTSQELAGRILQDQREVPPPNPRYSISDISVELAEVIYKALENNPADRYQSAKDFFLDLCKAAHVFVNELPDQLWAEVPISGAATVSYNSQEDLENKPRGIFSSLRLPYFQFTPMTGAILGVVIGVLFIGGYLLFSGFFGTQQSTKILPGYAYVEDGELINQIPGGQGELFKKGSNISTGPGSLITVGKNMVTLLLPGDYRIKIAGDPITVFGLVQETNNQTSISVLKLYHGSLFLISGEGSDKNRPVYIQTVSGRATLTGSIMGNRFDSSTQTFAVDCVEGQCQLEADETVNLTSGQHSQVDSSGIPVPPSPINLGLYHGYNLDFIPPDILAHSAPSRVPQNTPTPYPTIQFTPTPIPPTWTPIPTPVPDSGYGQ